MADQQGRFVWYDLFSTDADKARAFYTELFGWGIQSFDMGEMGEYPMFTANEKPFGGSMPLPAEAQAMGAPSHWLAYISVDDVDAAAEKAVRLGGKVMHPPMDIPEVGRFAVIADPQGGVVAPFKGQNPMEDPAASGQPKLGEACWHEFLAADVDAALGFYGELFGWTKGDAMDMGPEGIYQIFKIGEQMAGGMMKLPAEVAAMGAPPHWIQYTMVEDADRSAERAKELGAQILHATDVPGGRVAVALDPTGAVFAVHSMAAQG